MLWSEPQGSVVSTATDITLFETKYRQKVHSSIRRFIIVATGKGHQHSQCMFVSATPLVWLYANDYSPLLTYNHRGIVRPGINSDDAIIYSGKTAPKPLPGEPELLRSPIQIIPKSPHDKLEIESRVNYAKIYTVEHNVKVRFIGHVAPASLKIFMRDFDDTWSGKTNFVSSPSGEE